jgi:hypothetical protein
VWVLLLLRNSPLFIIIKFDDGRKCTSNTPNTPTYPPSSTQIHTNPKTILFHTSCSLHLSSFFPSGWRKSEEKS